VEIIIASGRSYGSLPKDVCAVAGIHYAITSNGAAVYRVPGGEKVRQLHMEAKTVGDVMRLTEGEHIAYEVFIDGVAYAQADYVEDPTRYGAPERAIEYVQTTRKPVEDIRSFIDARAATLESMDLIVPEEETKVRLWKLLESKVEELYITSSVKRLMELSCRDGGKHNGVRFIRELLGLKAEEVAAFGDGDNDAEMLREAGIGIAMANASEKCLAAADYVTKHHDEDGVAEAIYELLKEEA